MSDVIRQPQPRTNAEYEAEIDRVLKEIELSIKRFDSSHADIQRLDEQARRVNEHIDLVDARISAKLDTIEAALQAC